MKECTVCKIEKKNDEFPKTNTRIYTRCKECTREYARKHHHLNKEKRNKERLALYHSRREEFLEKQKTRYVLNREEIRKRANARKRNRIERDKINERSRKWAQDNRERHYKNAKRHKDKFPERHKARTYVMWALRLGVLIKPETCEKCNLKNKLQAHHTDYLKPLEVKWMCKVCHYQKHGKMMDVNPGE